MSMLFLVFLPVALAALVFSAGVQQLVDVDQVFERIAIELALLP